jgi:hypothetical protein
MKEKVYTFPASKIKIRLTFAVCICQVDVLCPAWIRESVMLSYQISGALFFINKCLLSVIIGNMYR